MATIKDISNRTGLGLATVSKFLNGGTVREQNRIAIQNAIIELGYTRNEMASGLRTNRSKTIGVVFPSLGSVFANTIVSSLTVLFQKHQYSVISCDSFSDKKCEAEAVHFLLSKKVDALVNMPIDHNGAHLQEALNLNVPVVLVDRMIPHLRSKVSAVLIDNLGAAKDAISYLLSEGHRKIGIILGRESVYTTSHRRMGYCQAYEEAGLTYDPNWIVYGDYTISGGYFAVKQLFEQSKVTALFTTNYEMTLGALFALNELKLSIPDEISFVGFDNQDLIDILKPRLTIVEQPLEQIGSNVAEILLQRLSKGEAEKKKNLTITLMTDIRKGDSVCTCKAEEG